MGAGDWAGVIGGMWRLGWGIDFGLVLGVGMM